MRKNQKIIKYMLISQAIFILALLSGCDKKRAELASAEDMGVEKPVEKIILATPFAPIAIPLVYMIENNVLEQYADQIELKIWYNTDQLRTMISRNEVDFVAIPSNTASTFYNNDIKLKLLKVAIWRVFYIVSANSSVSSIKDLKGKKVFVPFRGDQPDLIFQTVCKNNGMDPQKDLYIQYTPSPLDIIMNMVGGKAEYSMMIEPAASQLILKGKENNQDYKRVIDIQEEWGAFSEFGERIPNSGIAALQNILNYPEIVTAFSKSFDEAVKWTVENPEKAGKLAAEHIKGVDTKAFIEALEYTILDSVNSMEVRDELENMFQYFMDIEPKSIGSKIPDEDFYY